jgi:hypothetical protein
MCIHYTVLRQDSCFIHPCFILQTLEYWRRQAGARPVRQPCARIGSITQSGTKNLATGLIVGKGGWGRYGDMTTILHVSPQPDENHEISLKIHLQDVKDGMERILENCKIFLHANCITAQL